MGMQTSGLLKALIKKQLIEADYAQRISENAAAANHDIADYLLHHTRLDSERVAQACADYFNLPTLTLHNLPSLQCNGTILYFKQDGILAAAIYRIQDLYTLENNVSPYIISAKRFHQITSQLINNAAQQKNDYSATQKLNAIIKKALSQAASDVHIEPFYDDYHIRYRIDGELTHQHKISHTLAKQIITRLKVLSKADISQTRLPQDGRFSFTEAAQECDCRISFCPTIWGEKCVIRLLESNRRILQFEELGLCDQDKTILLQHISRPQGLILVTGPTGSGKTQTLYTILNYLNNADTNIYTLEDPVEIKLSGINQIHIDDSIGLTFATTLRSLLRQDPDIIMIGEIRDQATAELAIHAAHTGHLVLATLHTQDAIEAVPRLEHLGIKRYHIATTLKLVIGQRLIRITHNQHTHGRSGLFELFTINDAIAEAITANTSSSQLRNIAINQGFIPLDQAGLQKIRQNKTTLQELKRVINLEKLTYAE